jgi:mannan endo-1,4-beta-mannosidase
MKPLAYRVKVVFTGLLFSVLGILPIQAAADSMAVEEKTRSILAYVEALSLDLDSGVLSGQNCGHGGEAVDVYESLVGELVAAGFPRVALVGVDYGLADSLDVARTHAPLLEHWNLGGLVTVSWHARNPWTGGDSWDLSDANLAELITPGSKAYTRWMDALDEIARALAQLRDAGVVVLWRPLHEMNGNWFWWGMAAHPDDATAYRALWRQMHDRFTRHHGLNNLIWVYSVVPEADQSWTRPVDYYYPGPDVVDLVGIDLYADDIQIPDYPALEAFGKPLALTEFGPGHALHGGGDFDNHEIIETLSERYPGIVYWLQWHDWKADGRWVRKSIRHNQNAGALLRDPRVINAGRIEARVRAAAPDPGLRSLR